MPVYQQLQQYAVCHPFPGTEADGEGTPPELEALSLARARDHRTGQHSSLAGCRCLSQMSSILLPPC